MKYTGNPVLHQRDGTWDFCAPKVFWYWNNWAMSLVAGNAVLFYISPNLIDWTSSGSFGHGFGSTLGVWETPDLFELPLPAALSTTGS
jgi:sucrose-6-phosphate hydrolase SacC (GH32 family)